MKKLYMILPLALILCFMVSCQDKDAMAELEAMKAQAGIEKQNKALVRSVFEAWDNGDFETFKELLAPDYAFYYPSGSNTPVSREEMIENGKAWHNAFPDITFGVEEMLAVGDKVISRFIMRATHEGEFQSIPATGNKIEWTGIIITHIENGKVIEDKEEFSILDMMQQLGMELKPKEGKE